MIRFLLSVIDVYTNCSQLATFFDHFQMTSVRDALSHLCPAGPILNQETVSMEELDHYYGFVLYRTQIPQNFAQSTAELSIPGVRDRAIVFLGNVSFA